MYCMRDCFSGHIVFVFAFLRDFSATHGLCFHMKPDANTNPDPKIAYHTWHVSNISDLTHCQTETSTIALVSGQDWTKSGD